MLGERTGEWAGENAEKKRETWLVLQSGFTEILNRFFERFNEAHRTKSRRDWKIGQSLIPHSNAEFSLNGPQSLESKLQILNYHFGFRSSELTVSNSSVELPVFNKSSLLKNL